jgi:hypothetical protein
MLLGKWLGWMVCRKKCLRHVVPKPNKRIGHIILPKTKLNMFEYHCWALYVLFNKARFQFEMVLHSLATEVPLPGPPNPPVMDESLTDLELFRKHCLPILDPWPEAGIYYC